MKPELIQLFDRYTHGTMPRRQFLRRLILLAGSVAAARAALPMIEPQAANAQTIQPDDARLDTWELGFEGPSGAITGYAASLREGPAKRPVVIVIHQNKGLTKHIEDVARRYALEGFLALAPDALSPGGGNQGDMDRGRNMIRALNREKTTGDFLSAIEYAGAHERSTGAVGIVGYCWGGSMVGRLATLAPELDAGVIYYGGPPASADVANIRARIMMHYAGEDTRILARVPEFEAALMAANKDYQMFIYEGAQHAFNDDTSEARYNQAAASAAFERSVGFFREVLEG